MTPRAARIRARVAIATVLLALTAVGAFAQGLPARPAPPPTNPVPPGVLIQTYTVAAPIRSQRAADALSPATAQRLQRAVDLRVSGLPDRARDSLLALLREHPHHPQLVTELGRTHLVREDWRELERLAVAERSAWRDSTLLGPELSIALERLARPREALRVAVDAWSVSPADGQWAAASVYRLAAVDPRGAVSLLEAAAAPRPWRADLALGLARLHALTGRPAEAVRVLDEAEKRSGRTGLRGMFADESLRAGTPGDTAAALAALADLVADSARRPDERLTAARRGWTAAQASGRESEWAPRFVAGLHDVPAERWGPEFLLSLVRTLQRSGHAAQARALLAANPVLEQRLPELALERALGLAREGDLATAVPTLDSLARAWPDARFMLAEVQFFSGQLDSAHANYDRVAASPDDPDATQALDRMYLLEEAPRSPVLPLLGQLAWLRWRGARSAALALADSLWRAQSPRGELAARCAIELASLRAEAGDARGALAPLLVVCDSLADDRLAPLARQRAGDAYLALGESKHALGQYEECLARYPRAWNSAEVRRRVEKLRKDSRL